jgi:Helix-turn-helix domain
MRTQNQKILAHLTRGQVLTPMTALSRFGVLRLAARVAELKKRGHDIRTHMVRRGSKVFAAYRMA